MYTFERDGIRYAEKSDRGRAILQEELIDFMADIVISVGFILIGLTVVAYIITH